MPTQAQRRVAYQKELLRKRMLRWADPGPVYIPFIGDGDLAVALYGDRPIFGADIDPKRVRMASSRLKGDIRVADCDIWPFPGEKAQFVMADFDADSHPYRAFEAFWNNANKAKKVLLFFTDGHRQAVLRLGIHVEPDGTINYLKNVYEKQRVYNFYYTDYVFPWFTKYVQPYRVVTIMKYFRGLMAHWAVVLEK